MKLTYEKISSALPALSKLSKLDLKVVEAIKLARLIGKIEAELKPLEKTRATLFRKYSEEVENGTYKIKPESYDTFSKEYRELLETEIDIDADKVVIESDIAIDAASGLALGEIGLKDEKYLL